MIRRHFRVRAAIMILSGGLLTGCAAAGQSQPDAQEAVSEEVAEEAAVDESTEEPAAAEDAGSTESENTAADNAQASGFTIRVGAPIGPGAMGLVNLLPELPDQSAEAEQNTETEQSAEADQSTETEPTGIVLTASLQELIDQLKNEEIDAAILPANVTAVLYQQTEGGVLAADLCTAGTLTCVTGSGEISSLSDLSGKTVLMTGEGTSSEYILKYLLKQSGVEDCSLTFSQSASDVAAQLMTDPAGTIAFLPEPYATITLIGNTGIHRAFVLGTDQSGTNQPETDQSGMAQGIPGQVLAVRRAYAEAQPEELNRFLTAHQESIQAVLADPETAAQRIAEYGMIEKATVAQEALPHCGLTYASGEEMKAALTSYLEALYSVS
ncbi:MAG: ABC transporter substrate-binding protein, partial [Lachnospiraceae bacterium]|nr:ABC transporter substrate-binding protein [Lachnospiraceae bacterium]